MEPPLEPAAFRVDLLHLNGSVVVGIVGELDLFTGTRLVAELTPLLEGHHFEQVAVDCGRLTFVDLCGLRALDGVSAISGGATIVLRNLSPAVARLIAMIDAPSQVMIEDTGSDDVAAR